VHQHACSHPIDALAFEEVHSALETGRARAAHGQHVALQVDVGAQEAVDLGRGDAQRGLEVQLGARRGRQQQDDQQRARRHEQAD